MRGGTDRQQTQGWAEGGRELTTASRKCHSLLMAAGSFWILGVTVTPRQLSKAVSSPTSGWPWGKCVG